MNTLIENWITTLNFITQAERAVLKALLMNMNSDHQSFETIENLSASTGYAPATIQTALRGLRKKLLISTDSERLKPPFEINLPHSEGIDG